METILVIEDDFDVQAALQRTFESAGYKVEQKFDGILGLESFKSATPTAIILDLGLPGCAGKDVCRQVKAEASALPVIILSAIADVSDKVLLLELGADDYITKPFSPREMLARVQAAIRRSAPPAAASAFAFDNIAVDFEKMELIRDGAFVEMTPRELKLLKFLIKNRGRVVGREEILNQVWGYENYPSTRTVDNHILRLRQKIEENPAEPKHFKTIHSAGYKFVP